MVAMERTVTDLDQVRAIVTSWRNDTELSAARCMYEIAKVLEIDPPHVVRTRGRAERAIPSTEQASPNRRIE